MRIVFMGTPTFSVPILESLIANYEVVLVVTQPDKEVGRKRVLTPTPVKVCAMSHHIPLFQPERIKDDYEPIINCKPDIIITAAFGQFIPKVLLDLPPLGAINVHGSLLPKYRGGSPIQTAIIKGEEKTGITIMYMAPKMDSGDIISQKSIPILDTDNNETMFNKLSLLGRDLLLTTLPLIIDGKVERIKQNDALATFAYNITHEDQIIDWHQPSRAIFNLIRGLAPNPSALSTVNGTVVKIFEAKMVNYLGKEECGCVVKMDKELWVKTLDGALSILEIQVAGKNKMPIKSFLNGQKLITLNALFK